MNTKKYRLDVGELVVDVVRKRIKNLHLAVYPPDGRVRVAVPLRVSDEAIRLAVATRLSWIRRKQKLLGGQERQTAREYVSGESHYYLGRRYLLNVISHAGLGRVVLDGRPKIDLYVPNGAGREKRGLILQEWYRRQLRLLIPPLIEKWERTIGVQVSGWGVKKMKTRWGSCNIAARRIWLNLELAKKPVQCLEYIVVHEMVHMLGRHHNREFTERMDRFLPQWRLLRDQLNSFPLRHEKWGY